MLFDAAKQMFSVAPLPDSLGLAPCPFCGGEAEAKIESEKLSIEPAYRENSEILIVIPARITCRKCGAMSDVKPLHFYVISDYTVRVVDVMAEKIDLADKWNKRYIEKCKGANYDR